MIDWQYFSFGLPWVFLLIPFVLAYQYFQWKKPVQMRRAIYMPFLFKKIGDADQNRPSIASYVIQCLVLLIYLLLIIALSQPRYVFNQTYIPQESRYIVLALDLSKSMSSNDALWKGRRLNRLQVAKIAISEFVQKLSTDRLGLVVFGDQAYLITPPTLDHATLEKHLLDTQIGMAGNRTAIGDALALSVKHLKDLPLKSRTVILLTDGSNTAGNIAPMRAAEIANDLGIKVYTIGLGAQLALSSLFDLYGGGSVEYDEKLLKQIAKTTSGRFYQADGVESLFKIYQQIDQLEAIEVNDQQYRLISDLYYYPLLLSFLLMGFLLLLRIRYV